MKFSESNKKWIGIAIIPALSISLYFGLARQSDNFIGNASQQNTNDSAAGQIESKGTTRSEKTSELNSITDSGWGSSPFTAVLGAGEKNSTGSSYAGNHLSSENREIPSPEEVARNKKMEALGYMLPVEYYQKDFATLKALAKSGDAWAMMHLGERYYFELNKQPDNPNYDPKADYPKLAREQFMDALVAGKVRPASIISELYLTEKNIVEAYAWDIVAERLGDTFSVEWFKRTKDFQNLSDAERQQAVARSIQISEQLNQRAKAVSATIRF